MTMSGALVDKNEGLCLESKRGLRHQFLTLSVQNSFKAKTQHRAFRGCELGQEQK